MPEQMNACLGQVDVTERDKARTKDSPQGHSLSHFLRLLFRLLDEHQIRYCVLHSWEGLPDALPSDLDMAVHPGDHAKLGSVFRTLLNEGYLPVQHYHHGTGHRFNFVWFEAQGMGFALLDLEAGYREGGLILMRVEDMVLGRRQVNCFWTADPAVEFAYLLFKKTLKGSLSCRQAERLKALVDEIGSPRAGNIAGDFFGRRWEERVVEACKDGSLSGLLPVLKKRLWLTRFTQDPLTPVRQLLRQLPRLIDRMLRPIGLFLVVLGPDGVGKSTLVGRLAESLMCSGFNRFRLFHWRPNLLAPQKQTGLPNPNPHDEPLRGPLASAVVLLGVFLDYWLGYILVIRSLLARAGLVIFDRYYHDVLVDPVRFRYGGPMWLPRVLSRLIPPPDLVVLVLDADEDVILSRKQELPLEELQRQRACYQQLSDFENRASLIRTDQGIEKTCTEASRIIVDYMAMRFRRRHARWLALD